MKQEKFSTENSQPNEKARHTFLFAAFFSLSGLGGLPLPLLAGFTSSSVAIVVSIWKLKKMNL